MRILKIIFSLILVTIILLVLATSIFLLSFDFSNFKGLIAKNSEELLGRPIVVAGKIRPAFNIKNPGLVLNNVTFVAKKDNETEISAKTVIMNTPDLFKVIKTGSWKEKVDFNLEFVGLRIGDNDMGYTRMSVHAEGMDVYINPLSFKLFKSGFFGELTYSASKDIKLSGKISDFNYGQFSKDIEGSFDANLNLTAKGNNLENILNSLSGKVLLTAGEGKLAGKAVDLWASDFITSVLPIPGKKKYTNIKCGVGLFDINKGQAASRIIIDTDSVLIKGKGNIDIPANKLDLKFKPKPKNPSLINMATPIKITGDWSDPNISPTAKGVLTKVGGVLLGAVNPAAIALPFLKLGSKDDNPCLKMLTEK